MHKNQAERNFVETLGKRIREVRESTGLSSAEVARRLLMDRGNYTRIETGKTNPTSLTLFRLSEILECEVREFFD